MGYPELVKIHPNYNQNREDPDWDFLILKLSEPIPPEVATPVILNRDATVPNQVAQALLTVGFGRTEEGGKSDSKTLQHVLIPYVPNDMCQQNYGTDKIGPAMLCAGKGGSDACQVSRPGSQPKQMSKDQKDNLT